MNRRSRRRGGRGVAEFDVDESGIDDERVGCGLGEDGVGAGAEVLGADADEDTAVGKDADDCGRGAASGAVVGGGHAVADEFVAFAHWPGWRCVWTSRSGRRLGCSTRGDVCWTRDGPCRGSFSA